MTLDEWAQRWQIPSQAMQELVNLYNPTITEGGGSETAAQSRIRVAATRAGIMLWRNNSGAVTDLETGRLVRYGLANDSARLNKHLKSSDLIGITPVAWQGRRFGLFTAIECKRPGWRGPENDRDRAQAAYLTLVNSLGGIGRFATSEADLPCAG